MKKLFTLLSLLFLSTFVFAQSGTPYMTKTFSASTIENIGVKTSGGGITVLGSDDDQARVEVYIQGNNRKTISRSEIEERLEDYRLKVALEGNTLICIAENEESINWGNGLSISFKIYGPVDVNTDVSTSGGGISLTRLNGNIKFRTSGGGLELTDLDGNIKGSTSGGGIDLDNCDNFVDVRTSGGGIEAVNCDGDIKLSTSGGGISLAKMTGNIDARTSGGGISAEYMEGEFNASTSGGGISLNHIMANVKARTSAGSINANIDEVGDFLDLTTTAGNINIDLPDNEGYDLSLSGNKVSVADMNNFSGDQSSKRMNGTVNGGGMEITARASSGRVSIR